MTLSIEFIPALATRKASAGILALGLYNSTIPAGLPKNLDSFIGKTVSHLVKDMPDFFETTQASSPIPLPEGHAFRYLILFGLGKDKDVKTLTLETAGGKILPALRSAGEKAGDITLLLAPAAKAGLSVAEQAAAFANGLALASYKFKNYKTAKDEKKKKSFSVSIVAKENKKAKDHYSHALAVTKGVYLARDLGNEPPNIIYPASFAARLKSELTPLGLKVTILDDKQLKTKKMGGLTNVGGASEHTPRLVIIEWSGSKTAKGSKIKNPVALVGKGVTYDSGGLNIKTSGMADMKFDMMGAAGIAGTMKAVALAKLKQPVVAAIPLAENAISSTAYRAADVITAYGGKTVEVLNTDAEGRLILMDALVYIQQTYKPQSVIDMATLTGAIIVSLGSEFAGAFVNNDKLWTQLADAAANTGDKIWRMPLDAAYRKDMESHIADLRNIGTPGEAGSCTAAAFLEHFIEKNMPWAHIDIAGKMAFKGDSALGPKGAAGFGVRLLTDYIANLS
ncbi:MAG: leucyl aminopeptidase [Alphaproteobacteria bacterium]|nr:leucyl aminopeptidase [Alphaproteobacteria bacterium]